jgi:hypothetical protein
MALSERPPAESLVVYAPAVLDLGWLGTIALVTALDGAAGQVTA